MRARDRAWARVTVIVPVPPAGGVAAAQPGSGVNATNVVCGGTGIVTVTSGWLMPLLVTLME